MARHVLARADRTDNVLDLFEREEELANKRRREEDHPVRLALLMLLGAAIAVVAFRHDIDALIFPVKPDRIALSSPSSGARARWPASPASAASPTSRGSRAAKASSSR